MKYAFINTAKHTVEEFDDHAKALKAYCWAWNTMSTEEQRAVLRSNVTLSVIEVADDGTQKIVDDIHKEFAGNEDLDDDKLAAMKELEDQYERGVF